jgi:hypothetical protein
MEMEPINASIYTYGKPVCMLPQDPSNDASTFTYFLHAISTFEFIDNAETCEAYGFADLMTLYHVATVGIAESVLRLCYGLDVSGYNLGRGKRFFCTLQKLPDRFWAIS